MLKYKYKNKGSGCNMLVSSIINDRYVEYDNNVFEKRIWYFENGSVDYLHYIGNGKDIQNPKGNISCFHMFDGYSFDSIDLSRFDTSNIEDMSWMFTFCVNLKSIDFSKFNTSKVKSMERMFQGCSSLESLDLSSFDTSNVKSMSHMFILCEKLREINLSSFDTVKVKDMSGMFQFCESIKTINVSNFDTFSVESIAFMFKCCSNLQELDLSSFTYNSIEVGYANGFEYMFKDCSCLQYIELENVPQELISNVIDMSMFEHCTSLKGVKINGVDYIASKKFYFV